jgi:hypothetical protein
MLQHCYLICVHAITTQSPVVTAPSTNDAKSLARRLKDSGAAMYGAFWCSHCFDQKQAFGADAMADFPYVECYPDGWKRVRG